VLAVPSTEKLKALSITCPTNTNKNNNINNNKNNIKQQHNTTQHNSNMIQILNFQTKYFQTKCYQKNTNNQAQQSAYFPVLLFFPALLPVFTLLRLPSLVQAPIITFCNSSALSAVKRGHDAAAHCTLFHFPPRAHLLNKLARSSAEISAICGGGVLPQIKPKTQSSRW
jgi:hypothetical protein